MRKLNTMKTIALIELVIIVFVIPSPSIGGSENKPTANHSTYWSGVWKEIKSDWKEIGSNIKDSGTNIGHAFKNEFQKMPENFRQGYKATKNDFKTMTGSDHVKPTEN